MVPVTPPAAATTVRPARPLAPGRSPSRAAPARRPRRVSGPARPRHARERAGGQTAGRTAARRQAGLLPWLLGVLEALSSHRLLDRLIRGRLWIGIIAFALLGIVTLQLGLLKLNSGIGRALERSAALQRDNAALSIENSELTSGERVESQATGKLGMRLGSITGLHALSSHPAGDIAQAGAALQSRAQTSSTAAAASEGSTEAAAKPVAGGSSETHSEANGGEGEASAAASGGTQGAGEAHATSEAAEGHATSEAAEGHAASEAAERHATSEAGGTGEASASHAETAAPAGETGGGTAGPGG